MWLKSNSTIFYLFVPLWLSLNGILGQSNGTTTTPAVPSSLTSAPTMQPLAHTMCTAEITCNGKGKCVSSSFRSLVACECNDGWTTFPVPTAENEPFCNYEQKQQLTAFLFHFFLGIFGAGRFYIGDYVLGGLQLGITVLVVGSCCITLGISQEKTSTIITAFVCVGLCMTVVWWATDCVLFGVNVPTDANGVALEPW